MIEYEPVPPSDGGCVICWTGLDRGLLVTEPSMGDWVHPQCLAEFDVDSYQEFETTYL